MASRNRSFGCRSTKVSILIQPEISETLLLLKRPGAILKPQAAETDHTERRKDPGHWPQQSPQPGAAGGREPAI